MAHQQLFAAKSAIKKCGNIPHIICDDTIDALGVIACNLKKLWGNHLQLELLVQWKNISNKVTAEILKQSFNVVLLLEILIMILDYHYQFLRHLIMKLISVFMS